MWYKTPNAQEMWIERDHICAICGERAACHMDGYMDYPFACPGTGEAPKIPDGIDPEDIIRKRGPFMEDYLKDYRKYWTEHGTKFIPK